MTARLVAAALCLALVGALAAALAAGLAAPLDAAVNAGLAPYRIPWLLAVFVWITTLGTGAALTEVAVTATAFLWAGGRASLIGPFWATFLGAEATTWAVKYIVARPRPAFLPGVATALSPSFPSAHATATMAVIGFTAYAVARGLPGRPLRVRVGLCAGAAIALIGFSRLYLSLHYLSDVASGFLVGGAWLLIGTAIASAAPSPAPPAATRRAPLRARRWW